jgi:hypothetical protein
MTSSMAMLLGQQRGRRMRRAGCAARKLALVPYRCDGIRTASAYKFHINPAGRHGDDRAARSGFLVICQPIPVVRIDPDQLRLASGQLSPNAACRYDHVSQKRQSKAHRKDATNPRDKFGRCRTGTRFMAVAHELLVLCGQPGMEAELDLVHGQLHPTTRVMQRTSTDRWCGHDIGRPYIKYMPDRRPS